MLPAWRPDTAAQTQAQAMEVDGEAAAATQLTPMTLLGVFDGHRWASCGGKVWDGQRSTTNQYRSSAWVCTNLGTEAACAANVAQVRAGSRSIVC